MFDIWGKNLLNSFESNLYYLDLNDVEPDQAPIQPKKK